MNTLFHRRRLNVRGQALVEFVLILPLLIVIGLAFFDISFLLFTRVSVDRAIFSALNETLKVENFNYTSVNIIPIVRKRLIGAKLDEEDVTVSVVPSSFEDARQVTVTARFSRRAVSLMYFTGKSNVMQTVSVSRLIPGGIHSK